MPEKLQGLIAALLLVAAGAVHAQYKWVGADGTVNYGDRPPSADVQRMNKPGAVPPPPVAGDPSLPYALRAPTSKYPVVLYSGVECKPCEMARAHLVQRGIPFTEKQIRTAADLEVFKKLGFSQASLPAVSVGNERATGFEAGAWDQMLDAGGYPKKSMLPQGYKMVAPEPLTQPRSARAQVNVREVPIKPVRSAGTAGNTAGNTSEDSEFRQAGNSSPPKFRF